MLFGFFTYFFVATFVLHRSLSFASQASSVSQMNKAVCKSLVICGPSGVGKSTLIGKLLADYPTKLALSVSHTSRSPREGEIDGVHYHFVTKEFLEDDIANGKIKYIEHAAVHSNIYGTRSDSVAKIHEQGKLCILDVDRRGVMQIKSSGLSAKYLFMAPPSMNALEKRLRGRKTESEEQIALRLANAKLEMEYGLTKGNFDAVLVNDNPDQAYQSLLSTMRAWFPFLTL